MKKLLIVILLIFLGFYFYKRRLVKAFKFSIAEINDIKISDNRATVDVTIKVENRLLPNIVIKGVDLHVWLNGNYVGKIKSDDMITSHNGTLYINATFYNDDVVLMGSLMLNKNKDFSIKGKVKVIEPIHLTVKVDHHGRL